MSAPVLTFFNNKGGVGKTSLIYHLAWMFASLRKRVVIIDIDPQANLTAAFLNEEQIEAIWDQASAGSTIYQCVKPLTDVGDIAEARDGRGRGASALSALEAVKVCGEAEIGVVIIDEAGWVVQ